MLSSASGASTPTGGNLDAWFKPQRFAGLLALLVLAAFPDVIFGSRTFFHRDFAIFGYPLAHFHRESLWQGEIPLWNPFNNCGLPFLAQWNTMTLYPLSLFYVLFPLSLSLGVFCVLHLYLAGIGMYFLGFQWTGNRLAAAVAGIAFAFNGLTLSCLKWPNNIAALAWMPIVVLLAQKAWRQGRRAILLASLAGAAQMLTGGPEIILFTWVIVSVLWIADLVGSRDSRPLHEREERSGERRSDGIGAESPRIDSRGKMPLEPAGWKPALRGRKRVFLRFAGILFLIAGLTAAQMLPFFDLLAHSQRDAEYSDTSWPMPLWGWTNFLVPLFRCFPSYHGVFAQHGQYWVSSYYAGIGVLLLAGVGFARIRDARLWVLTGMMILSLALALGDPGYLYRVLRELFPPLQIVRFPIKFVVIASFALPLLAAFGIQALRNASSRDGSRCQEADGETERLLTPALSSTEEEREKNADRVNGATRKRDSAPSEHRETLLIPMVLFGATCLVLIGAILWFARTHPLPTDQWTATWQSGLSRGGLLVLIMAATAGLGSRRWGASPIPSLSLVALLWLDAMTHAPRLNPTIEPSVYEASLAKDHLKLAPEPKLGESRAMISPLADFRLNHLAITNAVDDVLYSRLSLFANANLLDSIPKLDGFFSLYVREESRVRALLYATTNASVPALETFLGVSQFTAEDKVIHWKPRRNFLAFATGGQTPVFADDTEILRAMAAPGFDAARSVYLPTPASAQTAVTNSAGVQVQVTQIRAHEILLTVEADAPAWVVVAQAFYHPWKAYVDGKPAKLWRANYAFQAVEVPAGRHAVQMEYVDNAFRAGTALSVLSLLACAWLWMKWSLT